MFYRLLIFCLFLPSLSLAADSKNSAWFGTFAKKEITENYYGWVEAQLRYGFDQGGTNQFLYRTGLLTNINDSHQLGFLYGYIQSGQNYEHRWTVQHVQNYDFCHCANLSHRARLEYRTRENSDDDAGRFRFLLRSEGETKPHPTFVVWDEIFINTTRDSWTGNTTIDRNRFFLGFKAKIFNIKGEFGYLNQYIPRDTGDISEHVIVTYWFF